MKDLTTLQLARKIADAVFLALHPSGMGPNRSAEDWNDPPTQAVIQTLYDTHSWFCRAPQEENGDRIDIDQMRAYEPVQRELFR